MRVTQGGRNATGRMVCGGAKGTEWEFYFCRIFNLRSSPRNSGRGNAAVRGRSETNNPRFCFFFFVINNFRSGRERKRGGGQRGEKSALARPRTRPRADASFSGFLCRNCFMPTPEPAFRFPSLDELE